MARETGLPPQSVARTTHRPAVKTLAPKTVTPKTPRAEATNPEGKELGRDDLMTVARALDPISAETFGMQLARAVGEFRGGSVPNDDETIIVLQRVPE